MCPLREEFLNWCIPFKFTPSWCNALCLVLNRCMKNIILSEIVSASMVWCSKQSIKQISIKNQVGTDNRYQKNRKQRDKKKWVWLWQWSINIKERKHTHRLFCLIQLLTKNDQTLWVVGNEGLKAMENSSWVILIVVQLTQGNGRFWEL